MPKQSNILVTLTCKVCKKDFTIPKPQLGRDFCGAACRGFSRRGTPENFWNRCSKSEQGCWEWIGSKNEDGYGTLRFVNKHWFAPRLAWTLTYGPILDGLLVCHKCDNPGCIRPDHLFLGTHQDNRDDMVRKGRGPTSEKVRRPKKLNTDQVVQILILGNTGNVRHADIAIQFGVTASVISKIIRKQLWKHISLNEQALASSDTSPPSP